MLRKALSLLLSLAVTAASMGAGVAFASGTSVELAPSASVVAVGTNFTVDVKVNDVTGLTGTSFEVQYDPALLEVVDSDTSTADVIEIYDQAGTVFYGKSTRLVADNQANNATGSATYSVLVTNNSQAFTGTGAIATIMFRAKAAGAPTIRFKPDSSVAPNGIVLGGTAGEIPMTIATPPSVSLLTGVTIGVTRPTGVATEEPGDTPTWYTSQASLTISGGTLPGASLMATLGSGSAQAVTVGTDGSFSHTVTVPQNTTTTLRFDATYSGLTPATKSVVIVSDTVAPALTVTAEQGQGEGLRQLGATAHAAAGTVTAKVTAPDVPDTVTLSVILGGSPVTVTAVDSRTYTFSVEQGQNGALVLTASGTDMAGNQGQGALNLTADTLPPSISAFTLSQTVTKNDSVTGNVTVDGASEVKLKVLAPGGSMPAVVVTGAPSNGSFSGSVPLQGPDGTYVVIAVALDLAMNPAFGSAPVLKDQTAPSAQFANPADGQKFGSPGINVTVNTDDGTGSGIASVAVNGVQAAMATTGTYTAAVTLGNLADQTNRTVANTLTAVVTDVAGNERTITRTVYHTVEMVPLEIDPPATVNVVAGIGYTKTSSLTITGTTVSTATLTVALGAGSPETVQVASDGAFTHTLTLGDGVQTVTVAAAVSDGSLVTNTQSFQVLLDTVAPTFQTVALNRERGNVVLGDQHDARGGDVVILTASTSEPLLTAPTLELSRAGTVTPEQTKLSDAAYRWTFTIPADINDTATFTVRVTDRAGNEASQAGLFRIDSTSPTLTIETVPSLTNTAPIPLTFTADDPRLVNSSVNGTMYGRGTFTHNLDPMQGPNTAVFRAVDYAGNETVQSVTVIYDSLPPTVTAVVPANGGFVGSTRPTIAVQAGDAYAGVNPDSAVLTLLVDHTPFTQFSLTYDQATGRFAVSFPQGAALPLRTDKMASVTASFTTADNLGNAMSAPAVWAFTVDTNFPAVAPSTGVKMPNAGGWFKEALSVTLATVPEEAPVKYALRTAGAAPPADESAMTAYTGPIAVGEGVWNLYVVSQNAATGNWSPVFEPPFEFKVDLTPPALTGMSVTATNNKQHLSAGDAIRVNVAAESGAAVVALLHKEVRFAFDGAYQPASGTMTLTESTGTPGAYSVEIPIESGFGQWRNLVVGVTVTDRADHATGLTQTLTIQVDTIAPHVASVVHDATRPLKAGEVLTVTAVAEAGLTTEMAVFQPGQAGNPTGVAKPVQVTETPTATPGLSTYVGLYTVAPGDNGTFVAGIRQMDLAGNTTGLTSGPVDLDTAPPAVGAVRVLAPQGTKVDNQGVRHYKTGDVITLEVETELDLLEHASPLDGIVVSIPGLGQLANLVWSVAATETLTTTYTTTYTVGASQNSDGVTAVHVAVIDAAGNATVRPSGNRVKVDNVAPAIHGVGIQFTGIAVAGNDVTIVAGAEPNLMSAIYSFTVQTAGGPEVLTGTMTASAGSPGFYAATYRVRPGDNTAAAGVQITVDFIDWAGNAAQGQSEKRLAIDTATPVLTNVTVSPADGNLRAGETLEVSFTSEPGLTAVASVPGLIAGHRFTETPGQGLSTYTLSVPMVRGMNVSAASMEITARDRAGNSITVTVAQITVDTNPPFAAGKIDGQKNATGWFVETPTLTLLVEKGATVAATDNLTSIAMAGPVDQGGQDKYTYAIPNGVHTIAVAVSDAAGNTVSHSLEGIGVDTVAPSAPTVTANATGGTTRRHTVDISGAVAQGETDGRMAVLTVGKIHLVSLVSDTGVFSFDNVPLIEHVRQAQVGRNDFEVRIVDRAGNVGQPATLTVYRDSTPPSLVLTVSGATVTVTANEALAATPTLSGRLGDTALTFTDLTATGNQNEYTATIVEDLSGGGNLKVGARAVDLVGNEGKGHIVQTVVPDLTKAAVVTSEDDSLKVNFGAGALNSGTVSIRTVSVDTSKVPEGLQLLGSGYSFTVDMKSSEAATVTFTVQMTGTVPPQVLVLFVQDAAGVTSDSAVGTTRVVSETGGISTVEITARLPHFSTWVPTSDTTPPAFVGDISVNGVNTTTTPNPLLNTATVTVTGQVDATATRIEAVVAGNVTAGSLSGSDTKNFTISVGLTGQGAKTIGVRAYDASNNMGSRDVTVTIDTVKPVIQGLQVNGSAYTTTVYTSGGSASVSGSTDDAAATINVAPGVVTGAVGSFNASVNLAANTATMLTITAADQAGNAANTATVTIVHDNVAPVVSLSGMGTTGSLNASVGYSVNEPVSGVTISVTGGATPSVTTSTQAAQTGITVSFPATGTYTVTVTATDRAGNSGLGTGTIVVDTDVPTVTATVAPNPVNPNTDTPVLSVSATIKGQSVNGGVIGIKVNGQTQTLADATVNNGTYTYDLKQALQALTDGTHSVVVSVTGPNALTGTTNATVTRDTAVAALVAQNVSPTSTTSSTVVSVTTAEEAKVLFAYGTSQTGPWTNVAGTGQTFQTAGQVSQTVTLPSAGTYWFRVTLTDRAGNADSFVLTTSVSRTEPPAPAPSPTPSPVIAVPAPTVTAAAEKTLLKEDSVTITGTVSGANSVSVNRNGFPMGSVEVLAGKFTYTAKLAEGENTFIFTAQNSGGSTSATVTVIRDNTPPAVSVKIAAAKTTDASATLAIVTEKGATVSVNGSSAGVADNAGILEIRVDLKLGANSFSVVAVDALGNRSEAATVSIERVEPDAPKPERPAPEPPKEPAKRTPMLELGLADSTTESVRLSVSGSAAPESTVTVQLDGALKATVVVGNDGRFSAGLLLNVGSNLITVSASIDGNTDRASVRITVPARNLSDTQGHWAERGVQKLIAAGVISGYEDGSFRPNANVTRAEFAKMIVTALGLQVDPFAVLPFADTTEIPQWARPYIAAAVKAGLITGFEDNTFRAGEQITRLQIAVIVSRGLKVKGVTPDGLPIRFGDQSQIPAWAAAHVEAAAMAGLITGFEDGTFRPAERATRAQAAIMTLRLMEK